MNSIPFFIFFQPVTKVIFQERIKSKARKHYDALKTPFSRVIDSPSVDTAIKQFLHHQYDALNPAEFKRQVVQIQNQLSGLSLLKKWFHSFS